MSPVLHSGFPAPPLTGVSAKRTLRERECVRRDAYPLGRREVREEVGFFRLQQFKNIPQLCNTHKIAVEIKSFLGPSKISEFYGALGQFLAYRAALQVQESNRLLYLAVPNNVYEQFFTISFIQSLVKQHQVYLLIYDIDQEVIKRWQPQKNTVSTFKDC